MSSLNMKLRKIGISMLALSAVLLMAGCSSRTVVTLNDGSEFITDGKPDTTTEDGFYHFKDISGREVKVRAADVNTIEPED